MLVKDIMTRSVDTINMASPVLHAAQMMKEQNYGSIPVELEGRIKGMITDRDIALQVASEDFDSRATAVADCMSHGIKYCYEDETIEEVGGKMAETRHRRFPVLNRDKRLVGIVSLGDISRWEESHSTTHHALQKICS